MRRIPFTTLFGLPFVLTVASSIASGYWQTMPSEHTRSTVVIHQLRIYEIFDGNKKAFHQRFRDQAMRIMKRYDFKIVATWESRTNGRTEFVYLLEWPDEATMKDRWKKFLADEEWIRIKKLTSAAGGPLVGEIQDRTLELTDYSPQRVLTQGTPARN